MKGQIMGSIDILFHYKPTPRSLNFIDIFVEVWKIWDLNLLVRIYNIFIYILVYYTSIRVENENR